jgi:hypothetical protein
MMIIIMMMMMMMMRIIIIIIIIIPQGCSQLQGIFGERRPHGPESNP